MDDNKHWSNTGEQIKGALADALQSGDFKNLNELVSQTVTEAVGKHISILNNNPASKSRETDAAGPYGKTYTARQQDIPIWQQRAQEREERKRNQELQRRQDPAQHHRNLPSIKLKRVGNISNVLYQVFGGIGLGIDTFLCAYGRRNYLGRLDHKPCVFVRLLQHGPPGSRTEKTFKARGTLSAVM